MSNDNTLYRWVNAKDELPEEHLSIFFKLRGNGYFGYYFKEGNSKYFHVAGGYNYGETTFYDVQWLKPISIPADIEKIRNSDLIGEEAGKYANQVQAVKSDYKNGREDGFYNGAHFMAKYLAPMIAARDERIKELEKEIENLNKPKKQTHDNSI